MARLSHSLLRMAALWDEVIVVTYDVPLGDTFEWGDGSIVVPDGIDAGDVPFQPVQGGWTLDPKGVSGGTLHLRGRDQSASDLVEGQKHPTLLPGDHALIEYGPHFRLFVQHVRRPDAPGVRFSDSILLMSLALALVLHLGALVVVAKSSALTHAPLLPTPVSDNNAALTFYGVRALEAPPLPTHGAALLPPSDQPTLPPSTLAEIVAALTQVPSTNNKNEAARRLNEFHSVFVPVSFGDMPRPLVDDQGLTQDEVNKAIAAQRKGLATCLEGSTGKGTLTLRWDVDPQGVANNVATVSSSLGDLKAEACIMQHVRGTRFPTRRVPTTVTSYPFKLGG